MGAAGSGTLLSTVFTGVASATDSTSLRENPLIQIEE